MRVIRSRKTGWPAAVLTGLLAAGLAAVPTGAQGTAQSTQPILSPIVVAGPANDAGNRYGVQDLPRLSRPGWRVPLTAQRGVVAIAAGEVHGLALKNGGRVIAWGGNAWGQATVPEAAQSGVVAISAGGWHSLALERRGRVVAWGMAGGGQAVPDSAHSGIVAISAGWNHSLALKRDGRVIAWGRNLEGQATVPRAARSGVVAISAGGWHSLALKSDGRVIAWGANNDGQIRVPRAARSGVVDVAADWGDSFALKSDGRVVAWGERTYGETRVPRAAQNGVLDIAAGGEDGVCALKRTGTVTCWGLLGQHRLSLSKLAGVVEIAVGGPNNVGVLALGDLAQVALGQKPRSAPEDAGTVNITVRRDGATSEAGSVTYAATARTATAGADFTAAHGTLSFAAGETSKTISVTVIDDTTPEPPETVLVTLTSPSVNFAIAEPRKAVLTITDDDPLPTN